MNAQTHLSRGRLLLEQDRYDLAADEFRQALASEPNSADAHALLSLTLTHDKDQWSEATREAEMAIHLEPDNSLAHYARAAVMVKRNQDAEALGSIREALAIDPYHAGSYALAASIHCQRTEWNEALDMATKGLEVDPEDGTCASLRALALERLGRTHDAASEAEAAVRRNPDSPEAHAMKGWALLQNGDYRAAQDSFREALRLDPTNEFARSGMVQSLNNNHLIFRLVFRFYSVVGRLSGKMQWAIMIGLYLGMRLLRGLAKQNPALEPFVLPILVIYLLFCLLTWISGPLFNTFLRFHPFGRFLLSRSEKLASNLLATCIGLGVLSAIVLCVQARYPEAMIAFGCMVGLTLPVSTVFDVEAGWPRTAAITCAIGLAVLCCATCALILIDSSMWSRTFVPYGLGILLFSLFGNVLTRAKVRH